MKILFNMRTVLVLTCVLTLFSCEYKQEVEDPIYTEDYAAATFVTDFTGTTVTEGDTIDYTITLDKMLDRDLTFTMIFGDGTAGAADFLYEEVVIPAYTLTNSFQFIVNPDNIPEETETVHVEIGIEAIGQRYLLNPDAAKPVLDLTITNVNDAEALTLAFEWLNQADDIDFFCLYDDVNDWFTDYDYDGDGLISWSAGASSDNPEILMIYSADPPGTYNVGIDPYEVTGSSINYTLRVGRPDQTNEYITGEVVMANYANLPMLNFDAYDIIFGHIFDVTLDESGVFTVEKLNK